MSKKALILLARGFEEVEFTAAITVLRRAEVEVIAGGLQGTEVVEGARKVKIAPDIGLEEATKVKYDAIILPGGKQASDEFKTNQTLGKMLKEQDEAKRIIAAICAAPSAVKAHKVCKGKNLTCYPTLQAELSEGGEYSFVNEKVVIDDNLITSQGPGTAFDFGLAIVEKMLGKEAATTVSKQLLLS